MATGGGEGGEGGGDGGDGGGGGGGGLGGGGEEACGKTNEEGFVMMVGIMAHCSLPLMFEISKLRSQSLTISVVDRAAYVPLATWHLQASCRAGRRAAPEVMVVGRM